MPLSSIRRPRSCRPFRRVAGRRAGARAGVTVTGSGFIDRYAQFGQFAAVGDGPETCIWLPGLPEPEPRGERTARPRSTSHVACRRLRARSTAATPERPVRLSWPPPPDPTRPRAGRASAPLRSRHPAASAPVDHRHAVDRPGRGGGADRGRDGLGWAWTGRPSTCRCAGRARARCDEDRRAAGSSPRPTARSRPPSRWATSFRTWDGTVVALPRHAGLRGDLAGTRRVRRTAGLPPASPSATPPTMDDRYRLAVFDDVEGAAATSCSAAPPTHQAWCRGRPDARRVRTGRGRRARAG